MFVYCRSDLNKCNEVLEDIKENKRFELMKKETNLREIQINIEKIYREDAIYSIMDIDADEYVQGAVVAINNPLSAIDDKINKPFQFILEYGKFIEYVPKKKRHAMRKYTSRRA